MLAGSALHFAYELSGFNWFAALFGSVNESTWEHLKLFWPGLVYACVQQLCKGSQQLLVGQGAGTARHDHRHDRLLLLLPRIVLPMYGEGTLWGAIGTGADRVLLGDMVAYRVITRRSDLDGWTRQEGHHGRDDDQLPDTELPPTTDLPVEDFLGYEFQGELRSPQGLQRAPGVHRYRFLTLGLVSTRTAASLPRLVPTLSPS